MSRGQASPKGKSASCLPLSPQRTSIPEFRVPLAVTDDAQQLAVSQHWQSPGWQRTLGEAEEGGWKSWTFRRAKKLGRIVVVIAHLQPASRWGLERIVL